jgi:hypothetical protein
VTAVLHAQLLDSAWCETIFEAMSDASAEWQAEFEAAARRPLATRFKYAFIRTYKPVLDDASFRAFDTMAEYRAWCERELPPWLGYGRTI